jgi:hypothetical protein
MTLLDREENMNADEVINGFKPFVYSKVKNIEALSPSDATELMIEYYSTVRADNCDLDADGDMLLFQCGTHDWGNGKYFEYNVTRQFTFTAQFEDDEEEWEEDVMWQLYITLKYTPSDVLDNLDAEIWCDSPNDAPDFFGIIEAHKSTKQVSPLKLSAVDIGFRQQ